MSRLALVPAAVALGLMLAPVDLVFGQARPRAPLAPGSMIDRDRSGESAMIPEIPRRTYVPEIVQSDVIRIRNIGNVELALVYWDGVAKWNELRIPSTKSVDVSCAKCAPKVAIQFHNGKEIKKLQVDRGKVYLLRWSDEKKEWDLSPALVTDDPFRIPDLRGHTS